MFVREWARRWSFLWHRDRNLDDLETEMRLHRELRAARLQREGVSRAEAVYAAERRFGNKTILKEASVQMWSWNWLSDLANDIRHTGRMLAANPLFSLVTVLTLALGIGANAAIFSVANAVLMRALPVHDPGRLFYVHVEPGQPGGAYNTGDGNSSFSGYVFEQLRARRDVFNALMAYVPAEIGKVAVRTGAVPEEAAVVMVSGDFFSGLGVSTLRGRMLTLADEERHSAVAVLSYAFWSHSFERSDSALGRTLYIKGVPFTVVGVLPKSFTGIEERATDVWIPLQERPELNAWGHQGPSFYAEPKWWCLRLIARLRTGVTESSAAAMLGPAFRRAAYEHLGGKPQAGESPRQLVFVRSSGIGDSARQLETPLYVLLAMVGIVLLIACGNVGMLLAARNAARQREFSLRMAIGGSRARLFRQLLAESLVLVASGALLGWFLALASTSALAAWSNIEISLAPDGRVLAFTIGIALLVALIFGLAPLLTAVRTPIALSLKSSAAAAFRDPSKSRASRGVVALQVALCLVVIVAAGLLTRTLRNLENEKLGFRTGGLFVFGLNPQLNSNSDAAAIRFFEGLLAEMRSLPGVEAATLMDNRIGSGWSNNTSAIVDGRSPKESGAAQSDVLRWNSVGPDYFRTLGVPVRLGRDFNAADSAAAPKVAIVNETFAKFYLAGREPLGHQVSYSPKTAFTIVGVAADSKYTGVREAGMPMAYFPYTQVGGIGELHIAVRTAAEPSAFWSQARNLLARYAPELPLLAPMTMRVQFDASISQERLVARLALCFGGLAVLLVATGLYGTLAYRVRRRTAELGVRMAIGARPGDLLRMVMRESLVISGVGLAIGLPGAFLATRTLASLLYGLAPDDPLTFGFGVLGIVVLCLAASLVPAMRAASLDPVVALRYE